MSLPSIDQEAASRKVRDELHKVLDTVVEMAPGLGVKSRETFLQIMLMEAGFTYYERFGKPERFDLDTILQNLARQMIETEVQGRQ